MYGSIQFATLAELAEFLKEFTGGTATFNTTRTGAGWLLTYTGGF